MGRKARNAGKKASKTCNKPATTKSVTLKHYKQTRMLNAVHDSEQKLELFCAMHDFDFNDIYDTLRRQDTLRRHNYRMVKSTLLKVLEDY